MSDRINKEPSLSALSFVLRHKELWPKGFEWNYQSCGSCAMGLAHETWNKVVAPDFQSMANAFNMRPQDASDIFMLMGHGVTASDVADRIDKLVDA